MRARVRYGAALATVPHACRNGDEMHRHAAFGGRRPDQGNHPTDHGPPEEQVQEEDACSIAFMATDNRGKEVQQNQERQVQHKAPLRWQAALVPPAP